MYVCSAGFRLSLEQHTQQDYTSPGAQFKDVPQYVGQNIKETRLNRGQRIASRRKVFLESQT